MGYGVVCGGAWCVVGMVRGYGMELGQDVGIFLMTTGFYAGKPFLN